MDLTRRKTLYGSSLIALATLAGCLEDVSGSPDEDGRGNDENGGDEDENDDRPDVYTLVDYETISYSVPAGDDGDVDVEALLSEEDADDVDTDDLPEDRREAVETFLEETDFGEATVVSIRVWVPNQCRGLEVEDVGVEDDEVTVDAAVTDESEDVCTAGPTTHLTALVRVVFDEEVPTGGTVNVTRPDGTASSIGYAVERETEGAGGAGTD